MARFLNDLIELEPPWSERPLVFKKPNVGYSPASYGNLIGAVIEHNHTRVDEETRVIESDPDRYEIIRRLHRYHFADRSDQHADLQTVLREQFRLDGQEESG
jgi:hypothetical protein